MDTYRGENNLVLLDSESTYNIGEPKEFPIKGTVYASIATRYPDFFRLVCRSLHKNRLNDPTTRRFTIFVPIDTRSFDERMGVDLIVSHSILDSEYKFENLPTLLKMHDDNAVVVRVNPNARTKDEIGLIDGYIHYTGKTIRCSNGIIHVIDRLLVPFLLSKYGVY
jgi:hypothetical protein